MTGTAVGLAIGAVTILGLGATWALNRKPAPIPDLREGDDLDDQWPDAEQEEAEYAAWLYRRGDR